MIGPWFLPLLRSELEVGDASPEYVVLRTSLDQAVARVCQRDGPGAGARVRHMHRAFSQLGDLEPHALDTTALSPAEVRARLEQRRAAGQLRLPAAPRPA